MNSKPLSPSRHDEPKHPPPIATPHALRLPEGRPAGGIWSLPGYSSGLMEIQDLGSQAVAASISAGVGDTILDYCAGNWGKALGVTGGHGSIAERDTTTGEREDEGSIGLRDVLVVEGGE